MFRRTGFNLSELPNLEGTNIIVTGGNIGLGFKSCLELARRNANVTIACRSTEKGEKAKELILGECPNANIEVLPLDLTNSASIENFANGYKKNHQQLDALLCNAGVVNLPEHQLTDTGIEMHMATNHLGHFLLVGRLLPLVMATPNARVIVVSSLAYKAGKLNFKDLNWTQRKYNIAKAYGDSKLANLYFAKQLNSLFKEKNCSAIAVCAHPGLTGTERQQSVGMGGAFSSWIATPVEQGVLPQLMATTQENVQAGDFFGPKFGLFGSPIRSKLNINSLNPKIAEHLWQVSEDITGFRWVLT